MSRLRFGLRTFLLGSAIAAVCIAIVFQANRRPLLVSLREDLQVPTKHSLRILEQRRRVYDKSKVSESVLILIDDGKQLRLAQATRRSDHRERSLGVWGIDSVNELYDDGRCLQHTFERRFDHEPTRSEIEEFKRWVAMW